MNNTSLFETIVQTLLSSQEVQPHIIRDHIAQYAIDAKLPYDLALDAVVLTTKARLEQKLAKL